jgi:hypothetical protein
MCRTIGVSDSFSNVYSLDRVGLNASTRAALIGQLIAITVLALSSQAMLLVPAILVIGSFPPGIVPITLGRVQQQLAGDQAAQGAAWSRATIIFALFQALAGYAYPICSQAPLETMRCCSASAALRFFWPC